MTDAAPTKLVRSFVAVPLPPDLQARIFALDAFVNREFGSVTVDEIHLYESRLGGGPENAGSTYILRHRAALASN